ncbi:amidase [Microbacterium thalassium]|uniref:Amidase n=1 Tax=Microbacterium thalassium TaxID=362649 RepID=A0A7X0KW10_9MICO|nr:amidase family protein [Microbacterium thalassium]MBB6392792.1 amidase [Microbacterium thalassium]GLK22977.1 indoleacetamide hydrolase [Microbacterium thalassium]
MQNEPAPGLPTARRIAAVVASRAVSAREVVEAHLARLEDLNPRLGAVTVAFADRARAEAASLDHDLAAGRDAGPLAGVPFTVKENIDLTWSATTNAWHGAEDAVPATDAVVVRRLRDAGAIPIGRGNMPDFGMRWDTDNDMFGRTLNPWDPERSAGGSSGGDAVAVATGMSTLGLGNDFGGSVRIPASAVGICGLRPSFGRVPRAAVREVPVALTLQQFSVNGPLARSVDDLALALDVLEGPDADDPVSAALTDPVLVPRRVGVVADPLGWGVDPEVAASVERAARALMDDGWELVDVDLPHLEETIVLWRRLACTDMLFSLGPDVLPLPLGRSASRFLRDSTAAAVPYESAHEYADAWARRAVIGAAWRRLQRDVPLILGPVSASRIGPPDYDLAGRGVGDRTSGGDAATMAWRDLRLTVAVNALGLPAVAVPAGLDASGMPTGVQVIGPPQGDRIALEAARAIEAVCGVPAPPSAKEGS